MVEGDGFEIRCAVYGTEGSNPSLSVPTKFGGMSEWSKETDLKSVVLVTVPRVRIPLPPSLLRLERCPSGRRCTLGRGVGSNRAPRVRIPLSPSPLAS